MSWDQYELGVEDFGLIFLLSGNCDMYNCSFSFIVFIKEGILKMELQSFHDFEFGEVHWWPPECALFTYQPLCSKIIKLKNNEKILL